MAIMPPIRSWPKRRLSCSGCLLESPSASNKGYLHRRTKERAPPHDLRRVSADRNHRFPHDGRDGVVNDTAVASLEVLDRQDQRKIRAGNEHTIHWVAHYFCKHPIDFLKRDRPDVLVGRAVGASRVHDPNRLTTIILSDQRVLLVAIRRNEMARASAVGPRDFHQRQRS